MISVLTDRDIGSSAFVQDFMLSWMALEPKNLRPERYGAGEPPKQALADAGDVQKAVDMWVTGGHGPIFKRVSKPRMTVDIRWNSIASKSRSRYPWGCTTWIDRSVGDDCAVRMFCFLIEKMTPAFASLTDDEDAHHRHHRTVLVRLGDKMVPGKKFIGTQIEDVLPGIYWRTYLGEGAVELLGVAPSQVLQDAEVVKYGGCDLIAPFRTSQEIGSSESTGAVRRIVEKLGRHRFFESDGHSD